MRIKAGNIKLNIEPRIPSGKKNLILFLHGFTGSAAEWEEVIPLINPGYCCAALDLTGHGKSDSPALPEEYTAAALTSQIKEVISRLNAGSVILAGYSMGGRAALTYAAAHPGDIKALILESASAGLADAAERELRRKNDELLAGKIKDLGITAFVDYWMNIPLFESQKHLPLEKLQKQRQQKLGNNVTGLQNSLLGFGTGVMPPLHGELKNFNFPALLITGGSDKKFTDINRKILVSVKEAKHVIAEEAGHNVHFEQPARFALEVNQFLNDTL